MDQRIERTRRALFETLVELIVQGAYDRVSIDGICKRAGVGRSTFYLHFTDKNDLTRKGIESSIGRLLASVPLPTAQGKFSFCLPLFQQVAAFPSQSRALYEAADGSPAKDAIRNVIGQRVRDELKILLPDAPSDVLDFAVQYVLGAFMTVVTWWLSRVDTLSAVQMEEMFQGLSAPALLNSGREAAERAEPPKSSGGGL